MDVIYGIEVKGPDDAYVLRVENVGESFGESKVPGAFWVDTFPLLRHIPAWMPGAAARKFGARYKPVTLAVKDEPFDTVKREMVRTYLAYKSALKATCPIQRNGRNQHKVAHDLIERIEKFSGTEAYATHELWAKDATAITYAGEPSHPSSTISN